MKYTIICWEDQDKIKIHKSLKDARSEAKALGEGYEAVRAHDMFFRSRFLGYTVVNTRTTRTWDM